MAGMSPARRGRLSKLRKKAGGHLGAHGSFPVGNASDWHNAARSLGRTDPANRQRVKARLIRLAPKYGIKLPASWKRGGKSS